MKKLILILIIAINIQLCFAHSEEFYLLTGNFGSERVGVRIDEMGENAMLRYFKLGEIKETVLNGDILKPGVFEFASEQQGADMRISLEEYKLNHWRGTLVDSLGQEQQIKLEPIDVNKINHPCIEAILKYKVDAYTALKTQTVRFTVTSTSRQKGGDKILDVVDNLANISSVRIAFKRKKMQADSINAFLIARHLRHIHHAISSNVEKPVYHVAYHIHVLTPNYISLCETVNTNYLGGKAINTQTQHFNKWISTAKDIVLEEILWFGEKGKNDIRYSSYEWHQYRYKVFGDSLLSVFSGLYPDKIYKTDTNPCDYSNVKGWQFPKWYILPEGIYFRYAILSRDKSCNQPEWSVVPWKNIKGYLVSKDYE